MIGGIGLLSMGGFMLGLLLIMGLLLVGGIGVDGLILFFLLLWLWEVWKSSSGVIVWR